jgi:hypothetical protein
VVRAGDLEIDLERYEARQAGQPLPLTTKELGLLVALARHPGRLVRREDLAEEVWGAGLWPESLHRRPHVIAAPQARGVLPPAAPPPDGPRARVPPPALKRCAFIEDSPVGRHPQRGTGKE